MLQTEHGKAIAALSAVSAHLLFLGLIIVINHLNFQEKQLISAPIYVHLGQYSQPPTAAAPAPLPPAKTSAPRPKTIHTQQLKKIHPVQEAPEPRHSCQTGTPPQLPSPKRASEAPSETQITKQKPQPPANRPLLTSAPQARMPDSRNITAESSTALIPNASALDPGQDSEPGPGGAYLDENYARIRDLIADNIVFPPIARKLGWKGRLTVSFTLDPAGNASAIHIVESSGKELLDRNVVAAIRKTAPFPSPKRMVTLVLPVTYNLR